MHPIPQHTRRLHNFNHIFGYVIQAHIELFLPLLHAFIWSATSSTASHAMKNMQSPCTLELLQATLIIYSADAAVYGCLGAFEPLDRW